ncbi:hypothetical protein [Chryseobacterium sp. PMSZPI]|uniref:hypothetical protein n=1 Tax=Chryseobacterium sp. PMSZPI TaxID=1033900 RepID=UPI000C32E2E4|nr:hypothetical protein [Chryseobacterium sp. PMSZPI]PKF74495.1 hypothetical protein CW752_09025 [Chryseobacterium sp. PMSZPI]
MKRKTTLSDIIIGAITVTNIVFLIPFVITIFLNSNATLLCISIFLILLEIELFLLFFIPNWKLLLLLKKNIIVDKPIRFSHFLFFIPFFFIGACISIWSVSKFYREIQVIFNDYRMGVFRSFLKGKFPGWITYSTDSDPIGFTAEIIYRCFFAGLWGFLLELGILIITVSFIFIIRPRLGKTYK